MSQIESWTRIPAAIRDHLIERMRDRNISLDDLNQLRIRLETKPTVPQGRGTKISARSSSAVRVSIPRHFFLPAR
jgi:hypothetical protein